MDVRISKLQGEVILLTATTGLVALTAMALWIEYYFRLVSTPIVFTVLFIIVLAYSVFKMKRIIAKLTSLRLGLDGEREVAEYLDNLTRRGSYVFHDIPANGFNIDHVVVSSHGIFTLETKTYSKPSKGEAKIDFNGKTINLTGKSPDSKIISQALFEATWLRNLIKDLTSGQFFHVTAIVVFPGWYIPQEQMKHKDIWVTNPNWIESSISKLPQTLTPDEIQTVVNIIRPKITEKRS